MKQYLLIPTLVLLLGPCITHRAAAQGCVAIRHFSSCSGGPGHSIILQKGDWQAGGNYRYFKSFRHFRGSHEEPDRVANRTEVINYAHALDLNLSYSFATRFFANLSVPLVYNARSSLYEHGRTERHSTYSYGLADVRLGAGYWLFSPEKRPYGNMALGLGIKMPTGNYNAQDKFYNVGPDGQAEIRPVDQSIQPGDGGWGLSLDMQAFQRISHHVFFYAGGFYLLNPRETNGTRTYRETLSPILANEAICSVPDQYAARTGLSYSNASTGLGASLGGRLEGVPVRDLIGGSQGFRRPGFVFSVEPGINYMRNNLSINLNVPVALIRNRQQSITDKETQQLTGQARHGDAAFADYVINVGVTYRFTKLTKKLDFFPPN